MAIKKNTTDLPALYVLPSNNKDLQYFSQKFKVDMMEQVVEVIEFAIKNNLPLIEVFQFKNSDFVITLQEKDYLTNLNNIYKYCMQNEVYEQCSKIVKLQQFLENKIVKK